MKAATYSHRYMWRKSFSLSVAHIFSVCLYEVVPLQKTNIKCVYVMLLFPCVKSAYNPRVFPILYTRIRMLNAHTHSLSNKLKNIKKTETTEQSPLPHTHTHMLTICKFLKVYPKKRGKVDATLCVGGASFGAATERQLRRTFVSAYGPSI